MKKLALVTALGMTLASCASNPNSIAPQYVSPMVYSGYSCEQIRQEMQRIGGRVAQVTGQQQDAANSDAMLMGVGLVLFWPALFFIGGDDGRASELGRLRGEHEALQQAGIQNNCFNSEELSVIEESE